MLKFWPTKLRCLLIDHFVVFTTNSAHKITRVTVHIFCFFVRSCCLTEGKTLHRCQCRTHDFVSGSSNIDLWSGRMPVAKRILHFFQVENISRNKTHTSLYYGHLAVTENGHYCTFYVEFFFLSTTFLRRLRTHFFRNFATRRTSLAMKLVVSEFMWASLLGL